MLLKFVERFPGGRLIVFIMPLLLLILGMLALTANQLTQVDNAVILGVSLGCLWTWRRLLLIFWKEQEEAANMWLSLGTFVILIATVENAAWSYYIRGMSLPLASDANTRFISIVRFQWAFGFGCLYLVPMARQAIIPPPGWISLFAIVGVATVSTLVGFWWF